MVRRRREWLLSVLGISLLLFGFDYRVCGLFLFGWVQHTCVGGYATFMGVICFGI